MQISASHISYLKRDQIDISKWDACVDAATNGLLYAKSWWLDEMSDHWEGLVYKDYEAVMPLTWRRKMGFYYLYQPWFAASLGLFNTGETPENLLPVFLAAIPERFRLWDIDLNEQNPLTTELPDLKPKARVNMFISAGQDFDTIRSRYSRLARRKLKLSAEEGVVIQKTNQIKTVIDFYKKEYHTQHPAITGNDYDRLIAACNTALLKGHLNAYTATKADVLLGAYLVLKDRCFYYSLLGGSNEEGKQIGAFYALTDAALRDCAAEQLVFRFEGSDIPGIAFFNSQFGAEPHYYLHLKYNRLPFPVNLLKA